MMWTFLCLKQVKRRHARRWLSSHPRRSWCIESSLLLLSRKIIYVFGDKTLIFFRLETHIGPRKKTKLFLKVNFYSFRLFISCFVDVSTSCWHFNKKVDIRIGESYVDVHCVHKQQLQMANTRRWKANKTQPGNRRKWFESIKAHNLDKCSETIDEVREREKILATGEEFMCSFMWPTGYMFVVFQSAECFALCLPSISFMNQRKNLSIIFSVWIIFLCRDIFFQVFSAEMRNVLGFCCWLESSPRISNPFSPILTYTRPTPPTDARWIYN